MALEIVKTGTYRTVLWFRAAVDIISLDYVWWHSLAEADDLAEPGEVPMPLGPDGLMYYGRFKQALQPSEPTWPDTFGHTTVAEAMQALSLKLGKRIRWQ